MGMSLEDILFVVLVLALLVLMLFLYRKSKKSMRANIRGILDEYKKLKEMAEKLRQDADGIIAQSKQAEGTHQSLKNESEKLRDALFDVRQKNKTEMDKALNEMKKEMKGEVAKEIERMLPKIPPQSEKKEIKELLLSEDHVRILRKLASVENELSLKNLFDLYSESFPGKQRKDFEVVMRDLSEHLLIREAYAEAGDFYYTISNQGILQLKKQRN